MSAPGSTLATTAASTDQGVRPRLLLLDGHSLAYRAFFALPAENFSTSTGQHTNAVYGFTSMLINVLRDEEPTHVAVAFDVSRKTFRSEMFADYKANRTTSPTDFNGQVGCAEDSCAGYVDPWIDTRLWEVWPVTPPPPGSEADTNAVIGGPHDAVTDNYFRLQLQAGYAFY